MDGNPKRPAQGEELHGAWEKVSYRPKGGKEVRGIAVAAGVYADRAETIASMLHNRKQQIDLWLADAPYSATRLLEKLQERGFQTMPGLQAQVDWASFEDHVLLEDEEAVLFSDDPGVFTDAVHGVRDGHEHQHADPPATRTHSGTFTATRKRFRTTT